ncbi:MAG TPA: CapA family protein, partial [Candidatus Saccharibacteria bacterium]|nr:CapA family protein [Candidatus Saccharibacteria bacterium]
MKIRKERRTAKRIFITAIIIVAISVLSIVAWYIYHQFNSENTAKAPAAVEKVIPRPVSLKSDVMTTGNIFWGRYMNDWAMASPLKYEYPFSRLNEFERDKYDAWIAGLECPTKSGVHMTSAEMEVALQFNCSPEYLPEAAKWFNIVSLANNHTDNQGVDGFAETQEALDKNGIQYFGHYDPRALNDICEVISLPVTVTSSDDSITKGNLPVALCGYHGVFRIPPTESLELMEKYSKIMPVIAFPHMGVEYQP